MYICLLACLRHNSVFYGEREGGNDEDGRGKRGANEEGNGKNREYHREGVTEGHREWEWVWEREWKWAWERE